MYRMDADFQTYKVTPEEQSRLPEFLHRTVSEERVAAHRGYLYGLTAEHLTGETGLIRTDSALPANV